MPNNCHAMQLLVIIVQMSKYLIFILPKLPKWLDNFTFNYQQSFMSIVKFRTFFSSFTLYGTRYKVPVLVQVRYHNNDKITFKKHFLENIFSSHNLFATK